MAGSEAFVGRERQLADLLGHWRAAAQGRGRFVLVEGEAGIGKTRLVEELVAAAGEGIRVAWG
ncbi:MAG TPA: AAA family ATPase, partial [Acidimicrobiales bacterium]|nr:AAA family ATPase [Acidimicrobiales bacterium]